MHDQRTTTHSRELRRNSTDAEVLLWFHLRDRRLDGHRFRRQHSVGPFIVDFACLGSRVAIELDGGHHADEHASASDATRTRKLEAMGWTVLRYWNDEVLQQTDAVLEDILRWLDRNAPLTPGPSPR